MLSGMLLDQISQVYLSVVASSHSSKNLSSFPSMISFEWQLSAGIIISDIFLVFGANPCSRLGPQRLTTSTVPTAPKSAVVGRAQCNTWRCRVAWRHRRRANVVGTIWRRSWAGAVDWEVGPSHEFKYCLATSSLALTPPQHP